MDVRVGTSGYNYPEWRGSFYPAKHPAARMLPFYAERFPTVEINYTFYRMPNARTVAGWDAATPGDFRFALKAPRRITHDARLAGADEPLRYFLDAAALLGAKLGPILFQLAPTFKNDLERLQDFLARLPPGLRCAFEFRHSSWFSADVYESLRQRNAALCIADTEQGATPLVATADFGYLRLRDRDYAAADLDRWAEAIGGLAGAWSAAYVYFKHEESGTGPRLARDLAVRLGS